jgi:two-component system NarL family response regulator
MTQSGLDSIQAEANDPGFAGPRRRAPKPGARSHSGLKRQDLENLNANGPILDQNLQDVSIDRELIRVLVADDHPILREGLVALINRQTGMKVVAEAADGSEAVALFSRFTPDVAVIDLRMPAMNGIETLTAIRMADPQARLVILTSFASDEDIYRALRAGARGYLVKDAPAEELVKCLRTVHEGGTFIPPAIASKLAERVGTAELTAREREVLALVAKGKANREIGSELDVTEGTIKVHVNNILNKLGVASRTEAVNLAVRRGLVRIDES